MPSPQSRSRNHLIEHGYEVATVEHWCGFTKRRKDLFGFADLFAVKEGSPPLLVQVTSGSNVSARLAKIKELPVALTCLRAGMNIEIHGWRKLKIKRGGKATRWEPRILLLLEEDLA